jgi:hypothetical protein
MICPLYVTNDLSGFNLPPEVQTGGDLMRRAELLQGIRQMKFADIIWRVERRELTQAQAAEVLGIELIPASSPEARGRSERMFGTLQARLLQELRLCGITTMEEANRFLKEEFLPTHNARFAVIPEDEGSAYIRFDVCLP